MFLVEPSVVMLLARIMTIPPPFPVAGAHSTSEPPEAHINRRKLLAASKTLPAAGASEPAMSVPAPPLVPPPP